VSCIEGVPPADINDTRKSMTFKLFQGGNDPNSTNAPCFLNPTTFTDYEITIGIAKTDGSIVTDPVSTTINSRGEFTLNVPQSGTFIIHVRIEQPCNICCNSFFSSRTGGKPVNCPSVNGRPIFEGEHTFIYAANEVAFITPTLRRCKCTC